MRTRSKETGTVPAITAKEKPVKLPKTLRALIRKRDRRMSYVSYCVSRVPGGREAAFEVLRMFPSEPDAVALVTAHDELDCGNRRSGSHRASLEEVLERAGVEAEDFLALLTRLFVRMGVATATMTAAATYPDIMEASVIRALDVEKGTEERKIHFANSGFLPQSKGIQIGIKNSNGGADPDEPIGPGHANPFDRTARSVVRSLPPAE